MKLYCGRGEFSEVGAIGGPKTGLCSFRNYLLDAGRRDNSETLGAIRHATVGEKIAFATKNYAIWVMRPSRLRYMLLP